MGTRGGSGSRRQQVRWCVQPLSPLMEGPDLEELMQDEGSKKESSWEVIREWFRLQRNIIIPQPQPQGAAGSGILFGTTTTTTTGFYGGGGGGGNNNNNHVAAAAKKQDFRLLLGVLGCPLAPIPLSSVNNVIPIVHPPHIIKDIPIENSTAHYIIQQYLAATGCLKRQQQRGGGGCVKKNMYTTGVVKMICCETEISSGKGVKSLGTRSEENGCFVLWQMNPGMWSLELVVGQGNGGTTHAPTHNHNHYNQQDHNHNKVIAGSDGKIVWRHTPWLGTHVAKGPHRPLRRIIQGLDPKSTASLFAKAQCLGEKRIGDEDCFVLKVAADRAAVMERNEGPAEVIRHVLYGYFSQKSGLLVYMEDSHLTRVIAGNNNTTSNIDDDDHDHMDTTVYWETTIGSSIGDYRDVDGVLIAHQGRTVATVFRFGELSTQHSRTRMEEIWRIDDVVFNVPGLSLDSFIPPADIFHSRTCTHTHTLPTGTGYYNKNSH